MADTRRDLRTRAVWIAIAVAAATPSALASHDDDYGPVVEPSWEASADGGMVSNDVARHSVASKSSNNSVESLFVTAVRAKPAALQQIGITDTDAATTAFDAATGAVRWTTAFDAGLGSFDDPTGIELNYNNNILHVVMDTGADSVIVTYAVSNGSELGQTPLAGVDVNGTSITVAGSEMALVGESDGRFYFADYESGPETVTIQSRPVVGAAYDVAIHNKTKLYPSGESDWAPGDTLSWRTFVATGREGNFTSGDVYTAAYRTEQSGSSVTPVWERRWNGPDGDWDEGIAVETGYVAQSGSSYAWTAGRTRDAAGNWDIVVAGYHLATGEPAWSGEVRTWGGEAGSEDAPVAMWYSDATHMLYVTGTTDRGFPHGTDIVTLAFDAITGTPQGAVFASGDISNGDDAPTDITTTHDGKRVFVAAEIHDLLPGGGGGYRAGLFAFDPVLHPVGNALFAPGEAGTDHAVGVAVDIDQENVLLGGSTDPTPTQGHDLTGASYDRVAFLPEPASPLGLLLGGALTWRMRRRRA